MTLSNALLAWYEKNRRLLPWRRNQNPYFVWISEIMLQQTTVQVVIPYFERFITAFPTVKDLASAPEDKVLSLWSGLGYYSRARNLQKSAQKILELGAFPTTYTTLLELSGVGPYTAAAIASIAFDEEVAAVDGNVIRVVTRLFDTDTDVGQRKTLDTIGEHAQELIKGQPPASHNQAMMELGATVCTPKNPTCLICPVMKFCRAQKAGTVLERPVKKKNRKVDPWLWEMYFVKRGEKIAFVKNANGTPWLNHLWVLPGSARPWNEKEAPPSHFKHAITHHKIYVQINAAKTLNPELARNPEIKWFSRSELDEMGVSSIVRKALAYVEKEDL